MLYFRLLTCSFQHFFSHGRSSQQLLICCWSFFGVLCTKVVGATSSESVLLALRVTTATGAKRGVLTEIFFGQYVQWH